MNIRTIAYKSKVICFKKEKETTILLPYIDANKMVKGENKIICILICVHIFFYNRAVVCH